ncbi:MULTISPECIES: NADP-dependent oxidoreductase [Sphingobium]|uniref:NADP-dependent oxidoreductase n=1 Tax=Sphingobium fuliginis (strain ATCC 27551) TaxID=336203 RepID=A0ABQ1EVG3_SPHSA|nr:MULTISPECIES: NADP-dependent oxidoreductase [Sphingobium]AJR25617.1 NADP-dependent oxidoreductase [Sphingobium sp. YBL2]RYL98918.1 NADP-dependent oxidoreductase [Sphingobium fuliginis]UXC92256.1 NADP-dependent oxidoreductase [Sphingobium sp. RSMS]WDA37729.1 NADP-dependent oxidoreductase [Sphingobium sp. YC-XJ3]GFZ87884.1 NADP-dependent oxidoreductase [Sphingobium fuliginis]
MQSREIHLKRRPIGTPVAEDFAMVTVDAPPPGPGEVQVRNLWMAVDPAMRGRMSDAKSYVPPFALDAPMEGPAIGEVIASNDPVFAPGDLVFSRLGWREVFNAPASALQQRDRSALPTQAWLCFAGMPGLTAYAGLMRIARLQPDEVVFVSAASGAVGSIACQIARNTGCKVIGSAGGPEKTAFLRDVLKVDAAIDYKAEPNLTKALAREVKAIGATGIDVYFENVGGDHLQAALSLAHNFARFAVCGMISQYNVTDAPTVPRNLTMIMTKRIRMEGFIALDHMDLESEMVERMTAWNAAGQMASAETVYEGIDKALDAFWGLFTGANIGRTLVGFLG